MGKNVKNPNDLDTLERACIKLSQEEFAFLCDIDRTYIGRIERLERKPTIVILDKIAKGLNIKLKDLVDFD